MNVHICSIVFLFTNIHELFLSVHEQFMIISLSLGLAGKGAKMG